MSNISLSEFGKIDSTGDPATFVQFLDAACAQESFKEYKRNLLASLRLLCGRVLDVGCGTGDDVRAMAALSSRGEAVGVDNSVAMIEEAKRRAAGIRNAEFHVADATALPFADGSFQATRADRSLMHVPEARKAFAEMVRVTATGGRVAVFEVDFGTVTTDCDDRTLARKVIHSWSDSLRDGWLGRRFPRMFAEFGLREIEVQPQVLLLTPALALPILGSATVTRAVQTGTVTADEGARWLRQLDELQHEGKFFATLTGFLVAATK